MDGVSEEDVVYRGAQRTVAYARDARGRALAKEYLEGEGIAARDAARLARLFERLGDGGKISNKEQFKKEHGEIWGFKSYQARLGAFPVGRTWYLTHGFEKKKNKWSAAELQRAERIRKEHLTRAKRRL